MTRRIGVEVSATAVRIVEISSGEGRAKLLAYGEAPLSRGAMVDGVVTDRGAVLSAIEVCAEQAHLEPGAFGAKREAWLAVAGLRAISRAIQMPPVPDSDLDAAVRLHALDIIPFAEEETLLTARSLGTAMGLDGSVQMRVHLAAVHRSLVDPLVEVLDAARFEVVGVDLASSALVRSLASISAPGVEAIVSIGAELTTIVIHEAGEAHFVRTIAGGGNAVTRAIAGALDIPFPDAEKFKIRLGRPIADASRVPPEAVAAARDASTHLLGEIRSSIDYFATLPELAEVSRIVVTGGGSQLAGFVERLGHQVGVPVSTGNWFQRVDARRRGLDLDHLSRTGAVAAGAALPEPAGRKPLDLLPPEVVVARKQERAVRIIRAAAVVLIVGIVGLGALRFLQVRKAEQSVHNLKVATAAVQSQIPLYDKAESQEASIVSDSDIALPVVSDEVNWPAVFTALAEYTPSSVSASAFSGTTTVAPSAASPTDPSGASSAPSETLPLPTAGLGTVSLSLTGTGYPAFQQWFDKISGSKHFAINNYSGVTSSGSGISFTAQLTILGLIHTDRLPEFQVPKQ